MTNGFLHNLAKLKEKTESQPKYFVRQNKVLEFKIYTFNLNSEVDPKQIVDLCKSYDEENFKDKLTNVNAKSSEYLIPSRFDCTGFDTLFDAVKNKVQLIWDLDYSYMIHHFWFSIYSNGDSSEAHHHGWVDLACVYYASVPEGSAPLVVTSINGEMSITPKPGMLVVMPGTCEHLVPKSEHDGERIIVAMNIVRDKFLGLKYERTTYESV